MRMRKIFIHEKVCHLNVNYYIFMCYAKIPFIVLTPFDDLTKIPLVTKSSAACKMEHQLKAAT